MVRLNAVDYESGGDAPPLLIVHGLFGSARNWNVIAKRLADRGPVRAVDLRNHGDSPHDTSHTYRDLAKDLAGAIDDGWDVVGHSMGGKAAMMLALTRPARVRKLIVADIAPVTYTHTQMQYVEAMRGVDLSRVERRGDADRQMRDAVPEMGIRAFLLQSLDVEEKRWKVNLDALEAAMDGIVGWPEVTGRFDGPALFLSGVDSDYVDEDGKDAARALFPKARFAGIPDAGHWLHAEKPREVEAAIRTFLDA